jgi:hypothetical protein
MAATWSSNPTNFGNFLLLPRIKRGDQRGA